VGALAVIFFEKVRGVNGEEILRRYSTLWYDQRYIGPYDDIVIPAPGTD